MLKGYQSGQQLRSARSWIVLALMTVGAVILSGELASADDQPIGMARIEGGTYRPLYLSSDSPLLDVEDFYIDLKPVTNAEFYVFTQAAPEWSPSHIPSLFAEPQYLSQWQADTPSSETVDQPVTYVSWFAADAYCQLQGKRLPSVSEWELVAMASEQRADGSEEAGYTQAILEWYGKPSAEVMQAVGQSPANYWGVYDMHGLVWEWTADFNSTLVSGESRADSAIDNKLFCAAGSAGSVDPSDYAAFMRYGFRSSLAASFTLGNLGFRCAREADVAAAQ